MEEEHAGKEGQEGKEGQGGVTPVFRSGRPLSAFTLWDRVELYGKDLRLSDLVRFCSDTFGSPLACMLAAAGQEVLYHPVLVPSPPSRKLRDLLQLPKRSRAPVELLIQLRKQDNVDGGRTASVMPPVLFFPFDDDEKKVVAGSKTKHTKKSKA